MKIEIKKIDPVKCELKFEIPKDRVSQKFDEVYRELGKIVKVKGFRPGKVPRHILEVHHNQKAKDEVFSKLVPEAYHEGITRENLSPLDLPEIVNLEFKDGVIKFTAKLDIKPDVKIDNYKGLKVKRKSSKVSEDEIAKTLEYFKKGRGAESEKEVAIDDSFAHGLGYPNLPEFKKSLERQLELDKDRQNRVDIENQIVESLIKMAKLTVPESLVRKQIEHRVQGEIKHLKEHGLSDDSCTQMGSAF